MIATRTAACGAALALFAAACGQQHAAVAPARSKVTVVHRPRGITVELPTGWQAARGSLTPRLVDPRQVLAVATIPLRYRPSRCAQVPGSALEDLGPRGALVTVSERGLDPHSSWADFPARPRHFGPHLGNPSEASDCAPDAGFSARALRFSDGDRHFDVLVAFGPHATPATRAQAFAILDSLRIDPSVRPGWPSSG